MDINDMVLVSVDDHVVEPPHLFEGRLPAKYTDLAPKFITRDDGANAWVYEGVTCLPPLATPAQLRETLELPKMPDSSQASTLSRSRS